VPRKKRPLPTPTSSRSRKRNEFPGDPTSAWARDVVDGRIVAGEIVRHAAERHLRDLVDGKARGLYWAPDKAQHAISFFPAVLTVTAGAKAGLPFDLLPWTLFCAGSLFGWHRDSGRLRFRHGWLETGKGQAKSPFMAAAGLYMVGFRGIQRAEGYAIAWDKDQANVPFKDAVAMCRAPIPGHDESDTLEARGTVLIRGTHDNAWKIEFPESGSKFQSLANGQNISGPRPCFVLADEIHEFKSGDPIETWRRAIAKMPGDALMLLGTNTPATDQITGTDYSEFYQGVAKGARKDDEAFAFIARVDKDDDPFKDESCWAKSLPALGITFPIENIRGEVNTARELLSTANSVKRLYFGIPLGASEFWISEQAWAAVQGAVDIEALRGCKCWLSLDLSDKNDLTALTAVWIDKAGHLWAKTWYWTTRDGLEDRAKSDNAPYQQWVQEEFLNAVPGPVIDKTFVAQFIAEIVATHNVEMLVYDPAGISDFMKACGEVGLAVWLWEGPETPKRPGLKLIVHGQGPKILFYKAIDPKTKKPIERLCMPRSIERLEDQILNRNITIEDSPLTYSCAANAYVETDAFKNRFFHKKKSRGRIDGLVTIAMATGAATMPITIKRNQYDIEAERAAEAKRELA
jgi:phage terminase large subunit-like protein